MKNLIVVMIMAISVNTYANESQYDFKSLENEDLLSICSMACGEKYTHKADVRDFIQLKLHPDKLSQAGLVCFQKGWVSEGTPCHSREYNMGIHKDGLAPTKTEVHGGNYAKKNNGAWCIAYNEEDFPGMKDQISEGKIKAGQVACTAGIVQGSF